MLEVQSGLMSSAYTPPELITVPICHEGSEGMRDSDMYTASCDGVPLVHLNTMRPGPWWKEHVVKSADTLQVCLARLFSCHYLLLFEALLLQ